MAKNYRGARKEVKMIRIEDLRAVFGETEAARISGAVLARITSLKPTQEVIDLAKKRFEGDRSTAVREAFSSLALRWLQDYPSEKRDFLRYLEGLEVEISNEQLNHPTSENEEEPTL